MAKSPISLLQELAIKQGYVPKYNYVSVKKDGIYNRFVCRVDCKEFNAEGVGNSKKDAKQNAAEKMLSLLAAKNEISILSPNKVQTSAIKIYEPVSPSRIATQSNLKIVNYIGLLQEFCVQQKLSVNDILYEVINESGPAHMKMFTIEVSIGSARERGSAPCKKTAKQEAAKNLLKRLHPNVNELLERNNENNNEVNCKETLQETIQKLGIEISECVISKPTLPVANLSKRAQISYMKCTNKELKLTRQDFLLKDLHDLFEKTYSNKISFNMRKKMQTVRDKYINHADIIKEIIQDIMKTLGIKIEKIILPSLTKGCIISLRLSSHPIITQLGMGETEEKAEIQAMYNKSSDGKSAEITTTDDAQINVTFPEFLDDDASGYVEIRGIVKSKSTMSCSNFVLFPLSMTKDFDANGYNIMMNTRCAVGNQLEGVFYD